VSKTRAIVSRHSRLGLVTRGASYGTLRPPSASTFNDRDDGAHRPDPHLAVVLPLELAESGPAGHFVPGDACSRCW